MDISVVVPVRDEAGSVPILAAEIAAARPHGQSAALVAGFHRASAPRVVTLDGDLQNDPADMPSLLALAARASRDVVNGVRRRRRDTRLRRWSSRIANGFRNRVTGESVTDVGCSPRTFPAQAARRLPAFRGVHRFLPTLLRLQGCTVGEIEVAHRARRLGRTRYGVHDRLWVGILDTLGVWWLERRLQEPSLAGGAGPPWSDPGAARPPAEAREAVAGAGRPA